MDEQEKIKSAVEAGSSYRVSVTSAEDTAKWGSVFYFHYTSQCTEMYMRLYMHLLSMICTCSAKWYKPFLYYRDYILYALVGGSATPLDIQF